jgi:hypothetical protein
MNEISHEPTSAQSNTQTDPVFPGRRGRLANGGRTRNNPIAGAVLIIIGIIFLGRTLGSFYVSNWWALFILLPAAGAISSAFQLSQDAGGRLTRSARASLLLGILLVCATAVFLFGLNWAFFGPVLIILAGLGILVNFVLIN